MNRDERKSCSYNCSSYTQRKFITFPRYLWFFVQPFMDEQAESVNRIVKFHESHTSNYEFSKIDDSMDEISTVNASSPFLTISYRSFY